jgi:hypothetical protein
MDTCFEIAKDENFYVIGIPALTNESTNVHEIAHALYYLDAEYKQEATAIINKMGAKALEGFTERLRCQGYDDSVMEDEIQAYILSGTFATPSSPYRKELERLYKKHKENLIIVDIDRDKQ